MKILAPVSVGEIFDKLSILQIKERKISEPTKLENVKNEIKELKKTIVDFEINQQSYSNLLNGLKAKLFETNSKLWDIEDAFRKLENEKIFEQEFVFHSARQVYITNDERAEIKKEINKLTGSSIIEEKHYSDY